MENRETPTILTLGEIVDKAKTNGWWGEIVAEVDRRWGLKGVNVPLLHKVETLNALFEYTSIAEEDLLNAEENEDYRRSLEIIRSLKQGDPYPQELLNLFEKRKPVATGTIKKAAERLISLVGDEGTANSLRSEWDHRGTIDWESDPCSSFLRRFSIRDLNQRYIARTFFELLELELVIVHSKTPFAVNEYLPMTIGEKQVSRAPYLAYRVYDPLCCRSLERYDPEYVTFPYRWLGFFPAETLTRLYSLHKAGADVTRVIVDYYNVQRLDRLQAAIDTCPVTVAYGRLFAEAVKAYDASLFGICSISLLAIIEGLLWAYAWWWNKPHGEVFDRKTGIEDYLDGRFCLKGRGTGAIKARPTIGLLLRETTFGDRLYTESVEYFCQELYNERNLVLHGRRPDYGDRRKAVQLLLIVEYLEREITQDYKERFADCVFASIKIGEDFEQAKLIVTTFFGDFPLFNEARFIRASLESAQQRIGL